MPNFICNFVWQYDEVMAKEIERKFLVQSNAYRAMSTGSVKIEQGYLNTDPERTVRVRVANQKAFITIKSKNEGNVRGEWEYEIPLSDARELLELCTRRICKERFLVPCADGLKWEIDEFHGALEGLVLAEIELPSADFGISLPPFIGREVSGDPTYYNSNLAL